MSEGHGSYFEKFEDCEVEGLEGEALGVYLGEEKRTLLGERGGVLFLEYE